MAGEPAMIGIRAEHAPDRCVIKVNDDPLMLPWPDNASELFVVVEGLAVGSHEVAATLLSRDGEEPIAVGLLVVTIRDPQARSEEASIGEGVRLLASPARPLLTELWDGRATLTVEGPAQAKAVLVATLRARMAAI